jgi:hypothetical protein
VKETAARIIANSELERFRCNEEFHFVYSSPNRIRVMRRRIGRAGNVERTEMTIGFQNKERKKQDN